MRLRYFIPLIVVVGVIGLFWIGLHRDPGRIPSPLINEPAPEFALPTLRDPARKLTTEHLKGRVTLVNVWASWCISCRAEVRVLKSLARRDVVPIIGIDYKDKRPNALKWLQHFGDPYTVTGFDASGDVGIDWGVYGVPETYVVDKKGYVRLKHIGPLTQKVLREKILPLVRQLRTES